ncbi:hypothetical protein CN085_19570 [Sinorhizobium meliloti]|uniref:hypothetical protein n=1 Tax=Rhizobium meliloti TaxID=382 RepID=UPI000FD977A1|nr:hypothetical protein [Sinorhizobium meliloti]RVP13113.1 hypothetical protein CN085_19570 [Sinorhizobium meliloti]
MSEKTTLWDKLGKTDPAHTKSFQRGGGFRGTAIKPMWSYRRMTEEFGPCGTGWGINEPSFQVVPVGDETLVYCTVSVWHENRDQKVFGVGGDKVAGKNKHGVQTDDEAFKKAFTDAVTNALKLIGVGADVHMGMFDDSKYVNTLQREFAEAKADIPPPANDKPKSSASLKRDKAYEAVRDELAQDMLDVRTFAQFETVKEHYRNKAKENGWNQSFLFGLSELFGGYEIELQKRIEAENLSQHPMMAGE